MNVQLKPMEILLANPRGFCGAVRGIAQALGIPVPRERGLGHGQQRCGDGVKAWA